MLPYRDSRFVRFILILFFILLAGYAIFEAQGLLSGPKIYISEQSITVSDKMVLIQGRAERITELRLNGATISVTEDGTFEEPYLLAKGSNRLILEARDARGRRTQKILDIVYNPSGETPTPSTTTSPLP